MLPRFRKVPRRFRESCGKVPQGSAGCGLRGSARFREGSAKFLKVFLRIFLAGKVPQGSAKVPRKLRRFRKVPRKLREGSAKVPRNFLRLSLASKVPQGSAEVPRKLREGSARFRGLQGCGFRKVPLRIPFRFPLSFPEGSAKVLKFPRRFLSGCFLNPRESSKLFVLK